MYQTKNGGKLQTRTFISVEREHCTFMDQGIVKMLLLIDVLFL